MTSQKLKEAINTLVAESRSAFVLDRSMLHNVLICQDILRHYNRHTTPRCLMKIDLRKAYDIVNWVFVEEALKGYNFPSSFILLIMTCVTSPMFTVRVHGEGQGFHVSFVICASNGIFFKNFEMHRRISRLSVPFNM